MPSELKMEITSDLNSSSPLLTTIADEGTTLEILSVPVSDKYVHPFPVFDVIMNVVIIGTLCIIGIAGNTLSIMVLQREHGNRVAVLLLQALAIADNSILLVSIVVISIFMGVFAILPPESISKEIFWYVEKYATPFGHMTHTATVWMTVLLAANRYIAICRPFQAQRCLTLSRAKLQVIAVFAFSVIYNLPRIFQVEIKRDKETGKISPSFTHIGPSSMFGRVYTNYLYSIFMLVLPLILLIILNARLVYALRASNHRMRRNSVTHTEVQDDNITFIMVIIIVVFMVCQTPDRVFQIISTNLRSKHPLNHYLQCFFNMLVVINSSSNFLIYYMFRKRFRKILRTGVCGCFTDSQREDQNGETVISRRISIPRASVVVFHMDSISLKKSLIQA